MESTLDTIPSMESTLDEIMIAPKNLITSDKRKNLAETAPSQAVDHLNLSSISAAMQPRVASTRSLSVNEYTNKFFSLATRSEFPWNEDVMISMHLQGLNLQISSGLATCGLYTMADAVQVAAQIEEEPKKNTSMRLWTSLRSCKRGNKEEVEEVVCEAEMDMDEHQLLETGSHCLVLQPMLLAHEVVEEVDDWRHTSIFNT
ncbi:unnamed protein product [Dovyalis caffra]|uniref:Uncharacterized protein n=1 Tax=Dovyalis caffra TaxID=77055 RepID=A0AAV1S0F6_9ROSI|nr:unnamed protein product [Dovyalis caffra]